ncbi:MAG: DinB family protein [Anaerolineae bacterium]|nr:DinB family protein [Anaerolineae bacterium]MDW8174020.1 DinB family protein [Anaerolineae bacterium]
MKIDFGPVERGEMTMLEFSVRFSKDDLAAASDASIDFMLHLLDDLDDADVTFDPIDEHAHDPFAKPGEENIGWSLAHLIAHVTASTEEGAAFSSILARGYPLEERPRYETPWRDIRTKAQCVQRLEESRRMRRGYLMTWPDVPFLDVYRKASERFEARFGKLNATASFLFGLWHETQHYEQMQEVKRQALAARAG